MELLLWLQLEETVHVAMRVNKTNSIPTINCQTTVNVRQSGSAFPQGV